MTAPTIPDWLKLALMNVKMATVSEVPDELRWKADTQLLETIEIQLEMAREEVRQQVRRTFNRSLAETR